MEAIKNFSAAQIAIIEQAKIKETNNTNLFIDNWSEYSESYDDYNDCHGDYYDAQ